MEVVPNFCLHGDEAREAHSSLNVVHDLCRKANQKSVAQILAASLCVYVSVRIALLMHRPHVIGEYFSSTYMYCIQGTRSKSSHPVESLSPLQKHIYGFFFSLWCTFFPTFPLQTVLRKS